jgi:hypothetical protein
VQLEREHLPLLISDLKDVALLAHPNLAPHAADVASLSQRLDGQEVVAHVGEAVAVILGRLVVHQLVLEEGFEAAVGAAMPDQEGSGEGEVKVKRIGHGDQEVKLVMLA